MFHKTKTYEHECAIRNYYAKNLEFFRENKKLIGKELRYSSTYLRSDMRTIDTSNYLREWEFKIFADYKALGQILQYLALSRSETDLPVRGVIAAFDFSKELIFTNERLNLNLELVHLPEWIRNAGKSRKNRNLILPEIPFEHS
ncbi:hypothetical protein [Acinetobacter indicus]|uniref:hypothetical protein n=1 Tax=Acinetobacter indicus TaxID=756892 RepID=UPI0025785042|nr:hypothetical protein [Acinetobacter indicus]MDM1328907.1 hypothetical protein [Acinetobacter indicus]